MKVVTVRNLGWGQEIAGAAVESVTSVTSVTSVNAVIVCPLLTISIHLIGRGSINSTFIIEEVIQATVQMY